MPLHLPALAARLYAAALNRYIWNRAPDFIVGADAEGGPYLLRWYVTPWRRWRADAEAAPSAWRRVKARAAGLLPNLYVHAFLRDDDDRALHDHPSWAVSFILHGEYVEHTIAAGGIHQRVTWRAGSLRFLGTNHTHRIELPKLSYRKPGSGDEGHVPVPCITVFLFGPTVRAWGFHCPERGWVPWEEFTAPGLPGEVGRGCDA